MINLTVLFFDLTALSLTPVPSEPDAAAAQQGAGGLKNKTLWIVIAAVAGITLIAIIIISVILCKKRSGDDIQRWTVIYNTVVYLFFYFNNISCRNWGILVIHCFYSVWVSGIILYKQSYSVILDTTFFVFVHLFICLCFHVIENRQLTSQLFKPMAQRKRSIKRRNPQIYGSTTQITLKWNQSRLLILLPMSLIRQQYRGKKVVEKNL